MVPSMPNEPKYAYLNVEQWHDLVLALMGQYHNGQHLQLHVHFWKAYLQHALEF